jgi:hypothetical protein
MEQAKVADVHAAIGQAMLEEPAEKLYGVKGRGTEAGTAHFPIGDGDGAVCEAHNTAVGDGDAEDIRGEGGAGRVAVVLGLTMDVPGDGPDVGIDGLQQTGLAHLVFEERAGDGGARLDRDKAVGSGGQPSRAVCCKATTGHHVMEVGVVLELPTPGMQDTSEPWESGPNEALVGGEAFEGARRGGEQGLVGEAVMRAEEGA